MVDGNFRLNRKLTIPQVGIVNRYMLDSLGVLQEGKGGLERGQSLLHDPRLDQDSAHSALGGTAW